MFEFPRLDGFPGPRPRPGHAATSQAQAAAGQVWPPFVLVTGLLLIGLVADDDGLGGGTGRIADLEPAVHAQEHPAEEGAGRAGAANVTSPARPPPQRAVLPLQPMAATATVAAKPAKSFGPGVRCSANA